MKPIEAIATSARLSRFSFLFNPMFWLALILLLAGVACYFYGMGAEHERHAQQAVTVRALEAQATANGIVLERERTLRTADRNAFNQFKEKAAHEKNATDQRIADLHSRTRRLLVPVRSVCTAAHDAGGATGTGAGGEGQAELTGNASEFLVRLLARGDDGIRKHAEVVDRYERLRTACTTPINP